MFSHDGFSMINEEVWRKHIKWLIEVQDLADETCRCLKDTSSECVTDKIRVKKSNGMITLCVRNCDTLCTWDCEIFSIDEIEHLLPCKRG